MRPITSSRAETFSIGELSDLSGVNIETIRYYERIKMLPAPPPQAVGGFMDQETFEPLAFIRRSRDLGFSLDGIRALLRLGGPEKAPCPQVPHIPPHPPQD